jgi:hypothetical protein
MSVFSLYFRSSLLCCMRSHPSFTIPRCTQLYHVLLHSASFAYSLSSAVIDPSPSSLSILHRSHTLLRRSGYNRCLSLSSSPHLIVLVFALLYSAFYACTCIRNRTASDVAHFILIHSCTAKGPMSETHAQGSKASHAIEPAHTPNPSQVQMETQLESEALRQPLLQLALHGVVRESEGLLVDDEVAAGEVCLGPGDSGGDGGSVGFEDDAEGRMVLVKV